MRIIGQHTRAGSCGPACWIRVPTTETNPLCSQERLRECSKDAPPAQLFTSDPPMTSADRLLYTRTLAEARQPQAQQRRAQPHTHGAGRPQITRLACGGADAESWRKPSCRAVAGGLVGAARAYSAVVHRPANHHSAPAACLITYQCVTHAAVSSRGNGEGPRADEHLVVWPIALLGVQVAELLRRRRP